MLFLEFHGTEAGVREQSRAFGEIAAEFGGGPFEWATNAGGAHPPLAGAPRRLLGGRSACGPAPRRCRPTSACRSRAWPTASRRPRPTSPRAGLIAPIVGHVGDGNFHVGVLADPDDPEEVARVEAFLERLVRRALAMDGTCTGEHGVGQNKMKYLLEEHPAATLDLMRPIKRAIDPKNIMNPGKMVAA